MINKCNNCQVIRDHSGTTGHSEYATGKNYCPIRHKKALGNTQGMGTCLRTPEYSSDYPEVQQHFTVDFSTPRYDVSILRYTRLEKQEFVKSLR